MTGAPFKPANPAPATGDHPDATFFRTGEGPLAALVDGVGYILVPNRAGGGFYVATLYRPGLSPDDWKAADTYTFQSVEGEAAFRAHVNEQAEHRRQFVRLARTELAPGAATPWGTAQVSHRYGDGILFHSTAGHGGFQVDEGANAQIHPLWRNADGWYEEDAEWAKVAASFPLLFTDFERRQADRTLRDGQPDAYEKIHDVVLAPGESFVKDRRAFERKHVGDWIVTAAINSDREPGFVECVAAKGAKRSASDIRRFLVPADEYRIDRFGFVIDEGRHRLYDGPSSFIGWSDGRVKKAAS